MLAVRAQRPSVSWEPRNSQQQPLPLLAASPPANSLREALTSGADRLQAHQAGRLRPCAQQVLAHALQPRLENVLLLLTAAPRLLPVGVGIALEDGRSVAAGAAATIAALALVAAAGCWPAGGVSEHLPLHALGPDLRHGLVVAACCLGWTGAAAATVVWAAPARAVGKVTNYSVEPISASD